MGADPSIHVWSAATQETLSVLSGGHQRAVVSVSLSQQGSILASIGGDDHHTLVLWNWRSGEKLASARSDRDRRAWWSLRPRTAVRAVQECCYPLLLRSCHCYKRLASKQIARFLLALPYSL